MINLWLSLPTLYISLNPLHISSNTLHLSICLFVCGTIEAWHGFHHCSILIAFHAFFHITGLVWISEEHQLVGNCHLPGLMLSRHVLDHTIYVYSIAQQLDENGDRAKWRQLIQLEQFNRRCLNIQWELSALSSLVHLLSVSFPFTIAAVVWLQMSITKISFSNFSRCLSIKSWEMEKLKLWELNGLFR